MKKKLFSALLGVVIALGALSGIACNGEGTTAVKTIVVDGGGDTANFNSTPSMTVSPTNPFPYNELEILLKEWEEMHPGYKVELRRTSYAGDVASLTPLLRAKRAPDIIYQNGGVAESHLGKGYYQIFDDYLDQPNPYNDNKPWREVYNEAELASTMATDGHYYYMNLERNGIGLLYNKTFFEENNIKAPETYEEFMEAQAIAASKGKVPYLSQYPWYNIALETNLFSDLVEVLDVLRPNGSVDAEEMCRGYWKGLWTPDCAEYKTYIDLMCEKIQYEPLGGAGYSPIDSFLQEQCVIIESTGENMRKAYYNENRTFELGVVGYPYLTDENGNSIGKHCYRGSAGTATSWWVTNTAIKNDTVDACMDLMMFLTSPQYNDRMIGKLAGAIPLNPEAEVADYLKPLVKMYNEDVESGEAVGWGAINSWNAFGLEYNSFFLAEMNSLFATRVNGVVSEENKQATWTKIKNYTLTTVKQLILENAYDTSSWGECMVPALQA